MKKKWIPFGTLLMAGSLFAGPITYDVIMNMDSESTSPGTGFAVITIDTTANTLNIVSETFTGLVSPTTASHIHCCTASPGTGTAAVATQSPLVHWFPPWCDVGHVFDAL
jgi:hypothetical protein